LIWLSVCCFAIARSVTTNAPFARMNVPLATANPSFLSTPC
jgi:hypothetical protein